MAGLQFLLWLAVFTLLLKCVPPLNEVLFRTDAELPASSQILWLTTELATAYWYLIALLFLLLAGTEVLVVAVSAGNKRRWLTVVRFLLTALMTGVPVMLLLLMIMMLAGHIFIASDSALEYLPEPDW